MDPGFMDSTMAFVMSSGAFFPGINAVVMMMSTSLACSAKSAYSASKKALLISLAYPPVSAGSLEVQLQEPRSEALHLLFDSGSDVEGTDLCAETACRRDRCQPCDTRPNDEHLSRSRSTRCSNLSREEGAEVIRCFNHRSVASNVGHRGEDVHLLSTGDSGNLIQGHDGALLLRQGLDEVPILSGKEQADEVRALSHEGQLGCLRRSNLEHKIGVAPNLLGARSQSGSRRDKSGIWQACSVSCARLNLDLKAQLQELLHCVGSCSYPPLTVVGFLRNSNLHKHTVPVFGTATRHCE